MSDDFNSEIGRLTGVELDKRFRPALEKLRSEFENHNDAARALYPLLDRGVIGRLFSKNVAKFKFDNMSKRRLIWYYEDGPIRLMYKTISVLIGQSQNRKSDLIDDVVGEYVYFRYHAPQANPDETIYQNGSISIFEKNGVPCFNHISQIQRDSSTPEHTGFVFAGRENMYLLGSRNGVLRLAISQLPTKNEGEPIVGLVLSVRTDRPYDPFAARFVMVRADDEKMISQLSDVTISADPDDNGRTLGEVKFFELTRGDYAWYLLALHLR